MESWVNILTGQLVRYMRKSRCAFGVLFTYCGTVFVKREKDFGFLVSTPVFDHDTTPSLRQALLVFSIEAALSEPYNEPEDFDEGLFFQDSGTINSLRHSPYRTKYTNSQPDHDRSHNPKNQDGNDMPITKNTVFLESDGIAQRNLDTILKGFIGVHRQV